MSFLRLLHTLKLHNGLIIAIYDHSKVYFGDYHHVRVNIVCSFDDSAINSLSCCPCYSWVNNKYLIDLRSILYTRTLDRMGVPSKDVESVTESLLNDFRLNSLPYISSQEFPKKLIHNEIANTKRSNKKYTGSGC